MPLYEYRCLNCDAQFDALRSVSAADAPIECPKCGEKNARRAISLFAAIGGDGVIAGSGSSCGSCASGSCAGCASHSSH
ncbi:MAG: zinc ribbon domain-containing protein [Anaerolineales bacterium]|nr:zinc ribbon domain-containing protein [Anaerolineales bacterium]